MIRRDTYGIIVQQSADRPIGGDGGDSAMRTGLMAVCGNLQDQGNISFFMRTAPGVLVRHPYQEPWNNPNNFTRDQLICWIAGAKGYPGAKLVFNQCVKRGFRAQNIEKDYPGTAKYFPDGPDILSPADMLFLGYCANLNPFFLCLLAVLGLPWFIVSLLVATRVNPEGEQNQMICQCLTYGQLTTRFYVKLHPDYKESTMNYWGGWRDQTEIGQALIAKVEETIK